MIASIIFNYLLGMVIHQTRKRFFGIWVLTIGVSGNLLALGYYKYLGFLVENLKLFGTGGFNLAPEHLPIGNSFFTFQSISCQVDVCRRRGKVHKNPFYLGLFISLFPQLIAGDHRALPAVRKASPRQEGDARGFSSGMRLFAIGLFRKVVIADTAGQIVDAATGIPVSDLYPSTAWLRDYLYAPIRNLTLRDASTIPSVFLVFLRPEFGTARAGILCFLG